MTQLRTRNLITDEEFLEERRRLQADIAGLQDRLSGSETSVAAATATFEAFVLAARAREWFLAGDPETKRQVLQIVGSNLLLTDKILTIEAKTPFRLIDEGLAGLQTIPDPIEPPHSGLTMRDFVGLEARKNEMWALVDDVRTFFQIGDGKASLSHTLSALVRRLLAFLILPSRRH